PVRVVKIAHRSHAVMIHEIVRTRVVRGGVNESVKRRFGYIAGVASGRVGKVPIIVGFVPEGALVLLANGFEVKGANGIVGIRGAPGRIVSEIAARHRGRSSPRVKLRQAVEGLTARAISIR